MKKILSLILCLGLVFTSYSQVAEDRPMPKSGALPKLNFKKPVSFTLSNGLKVLVVEDHKLPRVIYQLQLDNPPYVEGEKNGVSSLVGSVLGNGTKTISKEKYNEEVDFMGADIGFLSNGASARGLSRYADRILELMAEGLIQPLFNEEDFERERNRMIEGLRIKEKDIQAIAYRVENVLVFGKNHYQGEFMTEQTLNNVKLEDVVLNHRTYFVPNNAYLIIVGDVNFEKIKTKVENLFGKWSAGKIPTSTYDEPKDASQKQIHFIDFPTAVQSEISFASLSHLKMTDKDYFATLLANQVLGGGGEGRLFLNLREKHGWTYGSYSSIAGNKYVGKFVAQASVRNAVTDSSMTEIINEIHKIRTTLISTEDLNLAKAKYIGNFVMNMERAETIANFALTIEIQKLPSDFYEKFIESINAVTPQDVQAAAQKYFKLDNMRIFVVGKSSEILPSIEGLSAKLNLLVSYHDHYGNLTEKPVKKMVSSGVTAKSILQNYIDVIGGEKAVSSVKSIYFIASGTIQGSPLDLHVKSVAGKSSQEMKMMGTTIFKQVVNEKGAYASQQGNKQDITGDQLKKMQEDVKSIFRELDDITKTNIELKGIEKIKDVDAYVLSIDGKTLYYSVATGFKIAEANEIEQGGQKITQFLYLDDYKEVAGVKCPHKMTINMGRDVEFKITSIKFNEGVKDEDFN